MKISRRSKQLPIALRLWIWFVLIALIPLSVVSWITYSISQQALKTESISNLRSIANNKAERIESYANARLEDIIALSNRDIFLEATQQYLAAHYNEGPNSVAYETIQNEYRYFFDFYVAENDYVDLLIISELGDVVFSVQGNKILGENLYTGPYNNTELAHVFDRAKTLISEQISAYRYYPITLEPAIFVAAPIFDEGVVIAVAVLQIDNSTLYNVINDYTALGETGETIVGSWLENEVVFLTPLRHDPYAAFQRRVIMGSSNAVDLQQAVQGEIGYGTYTDYRNQAVLSVQRYLPSLNWGMVVKIDSREVFAATIRQRNIMLAFGSLTMLILSVGAVWASRHFTKPIAQLTQATRRLSEGHLYEKVPVTSEDEIGELTKTFNQMSADLSEAYNLLEDKVQERTRRLAALTRLSQVLLKSLDEQEICQQVVEGLQDKALDYNYVGLFLVDEATSDRVLMANVGWPEAQELRLPPGIGLSERPLLDGQVHYSPNVTIEKNYISALNTGSELDVPIYIQNKLTGVLTVESNEPYAFDKEDIETLTAAARQVGAALSNANLFNTLKQEQRYAASLLDTLQQELNQARHIQQNLLPKAHPTLQNLDLACFSLSASKVGGDFFTYHQLGPKHLVLAVGDISGKGMPAALLMGVSLAHFSATVKENLSPGDFLLTLNQALVPYTQTTNQNCALVYAELKGNEIHIANAGCIAPILSPARGEVRWLMAGGLPLGIQQEENKTYESFAYLLPETGFLVLISDGVVEAQNTNRTMFGFKRLEQAIAEAPQGKSEAILKHLVNRITAFTQKAELHDDMTLMVLQHQPPRPDER